MSRAHPIVTGLLAGVVAAEVAYGVQTRALINKLEAQGVMIVGVPVIGSVHLVPGASSSSSGSSVGVNVSQDVKDARSRMTPIALLAFLATAAATYFVTRDAGDDDDDDDGDG